MVYYSRAAGPYLCSNARHSVQVKAIREKGQWLLAQDWDVLLAEQGVWGSEQGSKSVRGKSHWEGRGAGRASEWQEFV